MHCYRTVNDTYKQTKFFRLISCTVCNYQIIYQYFKTEKKERRRKSNEKIYRKEGKKKFQNTEWLKTTKKKFTFYPTKSNLRTANIHIQLIFQLHLFLPNFSSSFSLFVYYPIWKSDSLEHCISAHSCWTVGKKTGLCIIFFFCRSFMGPLQFTSMVNVRIVYNLFFFVFF